MPQPVYICGPCSGIEDFNSPAFMTVSLLLHQVGIEHINPTADSGIIPSAPWEQHLRWCISRCAAAGSFILLPGWFKSRGATLEVMVADMLKIPTWEIHPDGQLRSGYALTLEQLTQVPQPMQLVFKHNAAHTQ